MNIKMTPESKRVLTDSLLIVLGVLIGGVVLGVMLAPGFTEIMNSLRL